MTNLSVNDAVFDRELTLRQAYSILVRFVERYNDRGESSTVSLMTDIGVVQNGETCDPAQIYDYLRVAGEVLEDDSLFDASSPA